MNFPDLGPKIDDFQVHLPSSVTLEGQYCLLEPINYDKHLPSLFESIKNPDLWIWVAVDAPKTIEDLRNFFEQKKATNTFYVLRKKGEDRAIGMVGLMNPEIKYRSIQIGYFRYAPDVQRTTVTTQSFYLMAKYIFQTLGFNRLQWKCHKSNEQFKKAAQRFGFYYQGCFREDSIQKGYYRDTLYYSILNKEWSKIKQQFDRWLSTSNFNEKGQQQSKLKLREVRQQLESV